MAFQFDFTVDDDEQLPQREQRPTPNEDLTETWLPAKQHTLGDLLTSLPERLSYSVVKIASPLGRKTHLLRRELFDVRVQLLREGAANDNVIDQLENSDIRAGVYEGGFKTWECSLDLASLLLDRGPRRNIDDLIRCDQIVELGAGSALPSMILFRHAMENSIPGITFTLADYNEEVLRLVTLPNLILNWAAVTQFKGVRKNLLSTHEDGQGELELTSSLLGRFVAELKCKNMIVNMLSGSWSSRLADMIPLSAPDMGFVVLAAETIYSPASTAAFVEILSSLLKRVKMAKAIVGAKKMYFGVGGSVDGLKENCRESGLVAYEVENHGVSGMDKGVGRALIEIQMY